MRWGVFYARLESIGAIDPNSGVTRGLDHRKSDVSDLRPFKVQNSGTPEFWWSIFFVRGWIATKVGCFRLW
jgi:hypothetical protein